MSTSASPALVTVDRDGPIAVVRINRPPLNLLSQDVRQQLGDAFSALRRDDAVRVVVFASGGKNFCAGADMKEFPLRFDPVVAETHWHRAYRMTLNVLTLEKPTIAAIEGACFGGGMELALSCDRRICAQGSKLGLPEINRGIYPGSSGMLLLADLIGRQRAKQIIMDGAPLTPARAAAEGVVDEICPDGDALEVALAMARKLAGQSLAGLSAIKRLIDATFIEQFVARAEAERQAFIACYQTADAREGNQAFFEKREPSWRHR